MHYDKDVARAREHDNQSVRLILMPAAKPNFTLICIRQHVETICSAVTEGISDVMPTHGSNSGLDGVSWIPALVQSRKHARVCKGPDTVSTPGAGIQQYDLEQ